MTLKGPNRSLTLQVRDPKKLDAIKVGDPVVGKYYEALAIEVKKAGTATPGVTTQQATQTSKPGEHAGGRRRPAGHSHRDHRRHRQGQAHGDDQGARGEHRDREGARPEESRGSEGGRSRRADLHARAGHRPRQVGREVTVLSRARAFVLALGGRHARGASALVEGRRDLAGSRRRGRGRASRPVRIPPSEPDRVVVSPEGIVTEGASVVGRRSMARILVRSRLLWRS